MGLFAERGQDVRISDLQKKKKRKELKHFTCRSVVATIIYQIRQNVSSDILK
jgi:hypothetical protein